MASGMEMMVRNLLGAFGVDAEEIKSSFKKFEGMADALVETMKKTDERLKRIEKKLGIENDE